MPRHISDCEKKPHKLYTAKKQYHKPCRYSCRVIGLDANQACCHIPRSQRRETLFREHVARRSGYPTETETRRTYEFLQRAMEIIP